MKISNSVPCELGSNKDKARFYRVSSKNSKLYNHLISCRRKCNHIHIHRGRGFVTSIKKCQKSFKRKDLEKFSIKYD